MFTKEKITSPIFNVNFVFLTDCIDVFTCMGVSWWAFHCICYLADMDVTTMHSKVKGQFPHVLREHFQLQMATIFMNNYIFQEVKENSI